MRGPIVDIKKLYHRLFEKSNTVGPEGKKEYSTIVDSWKRSKFEFRDDATNALFFGLIQTGAGPCGVYAAVQVGVPFAQ